MVHQGCARANVVVEVDGWQVCIVPSEGISWSGVTFIEYCACVILNRRLPTFISFLHHLTIVQMLMPFAKDFARLHCLHGVFLSPNKRLALSLPADTVSDTTEHKKDAHEA